MPDWFRSAAMDKKQGSGDIHPDSEKITEQYDQTCKILVDLYEYWIGLGICPEQARYILPQGVMVNWIWTGSLLAYARFYKLRSNPDTQKETRDLAELVGQHMARLYPVSWTSLTT